MTVVLNVDDNEIGRYTKTRILQRAGFEVVDAVTGGEGLDKADALHPDLVLLDVKLPDIDGIEVCSRLKAKHPTIPIIQISATFVDLEDRLRGLDNGADAYLTQPIEPAELVSSVKAMLRLAAAEGALRKLNAELEHRVADAIAEREKAEERLRQSQKMEAVGQLTGGIAHDFNNLLTVIVGSLDLLGRGRLDQRAEKLVANALEGAQRGVKLTSQLLTFSRIQRLNAEVVDVNQAIHDMAGLMGSSLGPEAPLQLELDPEAGHALLDVNQLEMAILNLAINARDAMKPNGGPVRLSTRVMRTGAMPDAPPSPSGHLVIEVADTGGGMPPEVAARAFDPFFTTKGVGRGTGLGLSQVYGFANQSGGSVEIASKVGKGTEVRIVVPRIPAPERPDATRAEETGPEPDQDLLVLVVDDDQAVRTFMVQALAGLGYRTREAANAADALDLIRAHPPGLLLADFAMPEVNGADLVAEARKLMPGLPVLIASGYADTAAIEEAAGSDAVVLRKPFRIPELAEAVRAATAPRP